MATINDIEQNAVYKKVLNDSFGGVLYDVANRNKYDTTELLELWHGLTPTEQNASGGIMKGVFNFLTEREV